MTQQEIESIKKASQLMVDLCDLVEMGKKALQEVKKNREEIASLKKEAKEVRRALVRTERDFRLIQSTTDFVICPNCEGDGGFQWETPEGTDGDVCDWCQGAGIIHKDEMPKPVQEEVPMPADDDNLPPI